MKILVSCNRAKLERKVDITVLRQIELIRYHADTEYYGEGWHQRRSLESLHTWFQPDLIFFAADYDYQDSALCPRSALFRTAARLPVLRAICMQDYWNSHGDRLQVLATGKFDILVTKNFIDDRSFIPAGLHMAEIVNPSGCDETVFHCDGLEKRDIDILVCGNLDPYFYPFRSRVARICQELGTAGLRRVVTVPHAGYFDSDQTQRDLANMLRRSKMAVACTGTPMRLHMQKMWEIPACGTVSITDINDKEPEASWLRGRSLVILPDWDDATIKTVILGSMLPSLPLYDDRSTLNARTAQLVDQLQLAAGRCQKRAPTASHKVEHPKLALSAA